MKIKHKSNEERNDPEELVTDLPVVEAQAEAAKGGRLSAKGGNVEFEWKVEEGES